MIKIPFCAICCYPRPLSFGIWFHLTIEHCSPCKIVWHSYFWTIPHCIFLTLKFLLCFYHSNSLQLVIIKSIRLERATIIKERLGLAAYVVRFECKTHLKISFACVLSQNSRFIFIYVVALHFSSVNRVFSYSYATASAFACLSTVRSVLYCAPIPCCCQATFCVFHFDNIRCSH